MMEQNQALIKRAEMAEEAEDMDMVTDLLKQLEDNEEKAEDTFSKMTKYFRENEALKAQGKLDKTEITNFQKVVDTKEEQLANLQEQLAQLESELKKGAALRDAQAQGVED